MGTNTPTRESDTKGWLESERRRLRRQIDGLEGPGGLRDGLRDSVGELSSYDNHPADLASDTFERGKDLALRGSAREQLQLVEKALTALESGTYGICTACSTPIDPCRMSAMPIADRCTNCKQLDEAARDRYDRPVEELVLSEFRVDGQSGDGDSGREDAWLDVALYGTSETLQDIPGASSSKQPYPDPAD